MEIRLTAAIITLIFLTITTSVYFFKQRLKTDENIVYKKIIVASYFVIFLQ